MQHVRSRHATSLLILGLGVALLLALAGRPASAASRGDLVVIGDSISDQAYYASKGNRADTIWWAKLARATETTPHVYAVRGSGFGSVLPCNSHTIGERIEDPQIAAQMKTAQAVVIAAGVNDYRQCVRANGKIVIRDMPRAELEKSVGEAMDALDAAVDDNSRVYVTVPFGPRAELQKYKSAIVFVIATKARAHGFTYVDTAHGTLGGSRTKDGIHPVKAGSQALYSGVFYRTNLHVRLP